MTFSLDNDALRTQWLGPTGIYRTMRSAANTLENTPITTPELTNM